MVQYVEAKTETGVGGLRKKREEEETEQEEESICAAAERGRSIHWVDYSY
jgi:hypothetical protein